jgi:hypothetical protein
MAREEREAKAAHERNRETLDVLRTQKAALETQKEEAKRLKEEEQRLMVSVTGPHGGCLLTKAGNRSP